MSNTNPSSSKQSGIIRWKGFLPILFLVAGTALYAHFFLDAHLRFLFEKLAFKMYGAQVDVHQVKTSIWSLRFEMNGIEVTSKQDPTKNAVEVGSVQFQLLPSPLWKKKFIIRESQITGIRYGTDRKVAGRVAPILPDEGPGFTAKLTAQIKDVLSKKAQEESLDSLTGLLKGGDPLKGIQKLGEDSHVFKKAGEVEASIAQFQKTLEEKRKALPSDETMRSFQKKLGDLQQAPMTSLETIASNANAAVQLSKEMENAVGSTQTAAKGAQEGALAISANIAQIDQAVSEDLASIQSQLKIPSLHLKDFSAALLGKKVMGYYEQALYWIGMSRKYFPKKSEKEVVVQERAQGTDVHFIAPKIFPSFLVEHAAVESQLGADPMTGNMKGEILGLTTQPPLYGKPTQLRLAGEFPKSDVHGLSVVGMFDHTTARSREQADFKVREFTVRDWKLVESGDLTLTIPSALGSTDFHLELQEDVVQAKLKIALKQIAFQVEAENASLKQLISSALNGFSATEIAANLSSSVGGSQFSIESDLGVRLANGIKKAFEAQIHELNTRLRKQIDDQVAEKKRAVMSQFDQLKSQAIAPITEVAKRIESLQASVQSFSARCEQEKNAFIRRTENEAKDKLKQKADEEAQRLKKNLKLPF